MGAAHLEVGRNIPFSIPAGYALSGWLSIDRSINNNQYEENRQGELREGAASRLLQTRYHLHHLDRLADSHPDLMPAQTPQLLLQIGHHQEEENQEGRGFILWLGIACQM